MPAVKTPRIASPLPQRQNDRDNSSPSPNYFGFHANESNPFLTGSSAQHAKNNWSPPTSAVRSAAAMSPVTIPNDQRPEFEAFRRQSEGKVFNLSELSSSRPRTHLERARTTSARDIPRVNTVQAANSSHIMPSSPNRHRNESMNSANLTVSQSPKRVLSPSLFSSQEQARRQSPATDHPSSSTTSLPLSRQSSGDSPTARQRPRFQSVSGPIVPPLRQEASTPSDSEFNASLFLSTQRVANLLTTSPDSVLLLDLRVSTMYNISHISSSLNLCIPTTLLKRPSFNVQKLTETFKSDDQRATFEQWKDRSYIIVYDNSSAQLKDASICVNTIKKFLVEGYTGALHIIKGGFLEFSRRYPAHVEINDASSNSSAERHLSDTDGPEVVPVAGGCPMPTTDNAANPFFSNIRQNMDLIGGVGTMALQHPKRANTETEHRAFPPWLRKAADQRDAGQKVSKKFENIERREKKRMEDALSSQAAWSAPSSDAAQGVRIAGLEKGSKNRYNNIWPFEHSRVKLMGVPHTGCDYFNANHIKAAWSNKRYISTQAPIPATFNDFWNVVWQQDVRVIMMLTAEKEGAQVKAHNYWDDKRYGPLHVDFLSEKRASLDTDKIRRHRQRSSPDKRRSVGKHSSPLVAELHGEKSDDQPFVIVRKFTLSHEGHPFERMREITQLQYANWPDFGAPADPAHLVGLVQQCDTVVRSIERTALHDPASADQRPVLVHCSAGCGRTGTFCTVDSVIDMLKRQRLASRQAHSTSPMDIDGSTPSPTRKSASATNEDDFFASQSAFSDEGGDKPDGPWLQRDDLDLVEKTVEDFRLQRISMVQSLRQYVLCYESIMEWLIEQELED